MRGKIKKIKMLKNIFISFIAVSIPLFQVLSFHQASRSIRRIGKVSVGMFVPIEALPVPPLNVNLALELSREYSPFVFWPVTTLIFNLGKGGQSYPIGPLAQEEGSTPSPSTFNKVSYWLISCTKIVVNIDFTFYCLDKMVCHRPSFCCYNATRWTNWFHWISVRRNSSTARIRKLYLVSTRHSCWSWPLFVGLEAFPGRPLTMLVWAGLIYLTYLWYI